MKALVELFWFKYSQLQHAVKTGNERLVSMLDREIEPALTAVLHKEASDVSELRSQFQFVVDLLREESEDKACVLRQAHNFKWTPLKTSPFSANRDSIRHARFGGSR